jgi:transcriptional regulator with XRE-family HTH domain
MALRETVAANIRRIRKEKGISQEDLADRAGVNRNYVGMVERCENAPTIDLLEKFAEALGVKPVVFLLESDHSDFP